MSETLEQRVDRLERLVYALTKMVALAGGISDERMVEIEREAGLHR